MDVLSSVTNEYMKSDIPAFNVGDTVKVHVKIKEGNRERIQIFEGFVLKRQGGGIGETFTVRSRLHYMRQRTGKSAKIKARKD